MRRSVWVTLLAMLLSLLLTQVARAASVSKTWGVGNEPFGVTIDPRNGTVFVAISDHNRWNMPTYMRVIDPYAPPPEPSPFPDSSFFELQGPQVMSVLDEALDRLFVTTTKGLAMVDLPTRAVTMAPIGAGGGLAVDSATHRVYVATFSGVVVVDGESGAVLPHRYPDPALPTSSGVFWTVAHDPSRHLLFVTNGSSPSLVVLHDDDLSLIRNVPLPAIPRLALTVDATAGVVYVGGFSAATGTGPAGSVYEMDEASFEIVRTLDVGGTSASPFSTTLDAATHTLYVSVIAWPFSSSGNAMVMVDTTTFSVRSRLPLSFQPGQSALHPDGHLYVSGTTYNGTYYPGLLAKISLVNQPPVLTGVSFSPSTPDTSSLLHASPLVTDPDRDQLTFAYEWRRKGVLIPGVTGNVLDLAQADNGDRGDTISVRVTASDGEFSVTREASVVVGDAAPELSLSLDSTSPRTNDVLHATALATDADGDEVTLTYSWTRNGATITGANGSSLDLALYGDRGNVIAVRVNADDGHGAVTTRSATATVADSAPSVAVSVSSGTLHTNDVLRVTATALDADQDPLAYRFDFRVNGVVVQSTAFGNDNAIFDLSLAGHGDRGDTITVDAFAWDYTLVSSPASATASVVNSPPVASVTLSDYSPTKKDPLVAYGSVFDADGDLVPMTYTWKVGSKVKLVVGPTSAASSSFDLRELQPGDAVTVTVTPASDGFDPGVPASATAVVRSGK